LLLLPFFAACSLFLTDDPAPGGWPTHIQVFFTLPGTTPETGQDAGIQYRIAAMVKAARRTVDICIYELSEPVIYESLVAAHKRGIKVRFAGDIDNTHYAGYKALMAARVPMRLGNASRIMHNKFIIVDDYYLTMGSANYTKTGFLYNNENVVFIQSSNVAAYYKKEMDVMFDLGTFGLDKKPFQGFTDNRFTLPDGTGLEVMFTPYVGAFGPKYSANNRLLEIISNARHRICFAMFAFTHPDIARAMIYMATNRGVELYGAFDKGWHTSSEWSVHQLFVDAGLNVRYDGNENFSPDNPYSGSKIHDKFMLVDPGTDGALVVTGSFNFSSAAATDGNDENCIVISNRFIADRYLDEFRAMWRIGEHPSRDQGGDRASFHDVWINEVHWPGAVDDTGRIRRSDGFIELKNRSTRRLDISGWQLTGSTKKSYRMIGYIFPRGTVLEPGAFHLLRYSTSGSAFDASLPASVWNYLYLHDESTQNWIRLVLKDTHQNVIDVAGDRGLPPFAGTRPGTRAASMQRRAVDGTLPGSWATTTTNNRYVLENYRINTLATPGTD
jgi:phosphatidylserine/phosphatidylglycerophosphate/cardiolipin synthase-like enzyme